LWEIRVKKIVIEILNWK